MSYTQIPCMLIRGGTSKGAYFLASDLPSDETERNELLIKIMGSGHIQQINGIGGGTSLTSKVAIISPSTSPSAQLDYLFIQVGVEEKRVDTKPSCGNILSGVPIFASECGILSLDHPQTEITIRNLNTNTIIHTRIETPDHQLYFQGKTAIDGVPGTGSPIFLNFLNVAGTKTGKLFPTGKKMQIIQNTQVTCIDAATPMVHIPASQLGKTGYETKEELDRDKQLLKQIEDIRIEAGALMGMGDVSESVLPKVSLIAPPQKQGQISSRYFVPDNCHASHAVTGAICVAVASLIDGTVAAKSASDIQDGLVLIEHPSGTIQVKTTISGPPHQPQIEQAALVRTARPLFKGNVYII